MRKELQEKTYENYPEIFKKKDLPETESCMSSGIETGDGWYGLIDMLCQQLQWQTSVNKYLQVVTDTPFNKNNSENLAPSYDEEPDKPLGKTDTNDSKRKIQNSARWRFSL